MANEPIISDIDLASSLSQMAENTTAAELVRKQGQSKKVKVLSERKLMEWIHAILSQQLAGRQDSFSDQEKEELLRKTQEELAKRIQREQTAERERAKAQAELEQVMSQISASGGDSAGLDEALKALRAQLEEAQAARLDLEQDTYELQDQLQEKLNLLSTTIAEKDKLRDAVRNQMLRSNALVEGVLGLDSQYYASRHQEQSPVDDEAGDDERFYHDFDIGAAVIQTLSQDLEKLRTITGTLGDGTGDQRSLEQDLALLSEVKSGSLHAMDVAAPISGLVEALAGARIEAEALDEAVAEATGGTAHPISELPDSDGDPGEVLAGATAVVRELAAELARDRQRIAALRNLTDEADNARHATEEELEALRASNARLLEALAAKAPAEVAQVFSDDQAGDEARIAAISQLAVAPSGELEALHAELEQARADLRRHEATARAKQQEHEHALESLRKQGDEDAAARHRAVARAVVEAARGDDQLADTAADLSLGIDPEGGADPGYADQVLAAVESLTRRKLELERELAQAHAEVEAARATASEAEQGRLETQRLKREVDDTVTAAHGASEEAATAAARVEHMRRELDAATNQVRLAQDEAEAAKADAAEAVAKVRELESKHAERIRTDKALAGELLAVTRHDDLLADVTTDLSVALDDEHEAPDLRQQLHKTVSALAQRQQSLNAENAKLSNDSERMRAEVGEAKRSLAETQRTVAHAVIQAAKDDEDLKDSVSQLEWALERMRPGEPLPSDLLQLLNDALGKLAGRRQTLQSERDEMALSGKEIITALTASRDQREAELRELRPAHDEAINRLVMLESRAASAESANRDLAEALSRAATSLPAETEEARLDLELALSQLPDEGEEGIEVPADVSQQIATHGTRVAHALATGQARAAAELAKSEAERARVQAQLDDRSAAASRATGELSAVRKELADARMLQATNETRAEALRQDLARLREEAALSAKTLAEARGELDREHERLMSQNDDLALRTAEIEGLKSRIANLEKQIALSQADLVEHHARGGASAEGLRGEVINLRKELATEREAAKARDAELMELREKSESGEARIKRLREEFTKRVEERDNLLQEKDRQLDAIADHKADLTGLQAQVAALNGQLASANTRIHELEMATGTTASVTSRHSNLGVELKRTQADRDLLREQKRSMEADLAEANSVNAELRAQIDEIRKELLPVRERLQIELDAVRARNTQLSDELGATRADKIGLEHKLRKLTETNK